jgi:hypothetical protein
MPSNLQLERLRLAAQHIMQGEDRTKEAESLAGNLCFCGLAQSLLMIAADTKEPVVLATALVRRLLNCPAGKGFVDSTNTPYMRELVAGAAGDGRPENPSLIVAFARRLGEVDEVQYRRLEEEAIALAAAFKLYAKAMKPPEKGGAKEAKSA